MGLVRKKGSMAAEHPAVSASLPIPYPEPLLLASPPRPGLLTAGRGALTLDTKRECVDGGLASLWGCGLLGITSCSSSLTPYCWDHFISVFIQLTNTLEQLLCVKDCSRYERYGRHQDLKVIPFTDLTLEWEKLGSHPPRCPLTRARPCRTQPAPVFIPLMILIIPQGSRLLAFSLSLPEVRKKEKHTANIIFFPEMNPPTYSKSLMLFNRIFTISVWSTCPWVTPFAQSFLRESIFTFFLHERLCFKHQFRFAPLQPPGVREMWDPIQHVSHRDSSQSSSAHWQFTA